MTLPVTLPAAYFDAMYQAAADPWGFEDRWYEQRKYAISLAQLPAARYRSAFEPGCSVGVLTRLLASRCDTLLSCDVAAAAVRAAAGRTQDLRARPGRAARHFPAMAWPLRPRGVLRDPVLLRRPRPGAGPEERGVCPGAGGHAARRALAASRGRLSRGPENDVHRVLAAQPGLARLVRHEEPDFLAEVWIRTEGRPVSVAQSTGLA